MTPENTVMERHGCPTTPSQGSFSCFQFSDPSQGTFSIPSITISQISTEKLSYTQGEFFLCPDNAQYAKKSHGLLI